MNAPSNWRDVMGTVAAVFHFPPSELGALTVRELLEWHKQAERVVREMNRRR